jgi:putative aminopeptidase FrvX
LEWEKDHFSSGDGREALAIARFFAHSSFSARIAEIGFCFTLLWLRRHFNTERPLMIQKDRLDFFKKLVQTPGISGFEERACNLWLEEMKKYSDSQMKDVNGSGIATLKGKSETSSILMTAHMDQLGLLVRYIDEKGFLYFATVGSFDNATLVSQKVTVLGPKGDIPGIIGTTAIHMVPRSERNTKPVDVGGLWIDIGAKSKEEAEQYAPVGTPVQVGDNWIELLNGRIAGRIDNRFGVFVMTEVMRRLAEKKDQLYPTIHCAATVQEETAIGAHGAQAVAYRLMPKAAIAVDVEQASDTPGIDKKLHGDTSMGEGVVLNVGVMPNNRLVQAMKDAAGSVDVPVQLEYNNAYSFTDADVMPGIQTGIPSVYIGNPMRYMHHTVEMTDLKDVEDLIDVLEAYLLSIQDEVDYTP